MNQDFEDFCRCYQRDFGVDRLSAEQIERLRQQYNGYPSRIKKA